MQIRAKMSIARCIRRPFYRLGIALLTFTAVTFGYYALFYVRGSLISSTSRRSPASPLARLAIRSGVASFQAQSGQACVHPALELWHPALRTYFKEVPQLICSSEPDWVYVDNGTYRVSYEAVERHGKIGCDYTGIQRGEDDFNIEDGESIYDVKDGYLITDDFFHVRCSAEDGSGYENIHAGIKRPRAKDSTPDPTDKLNVLMFGFDSVSRMTWIRSLPRVHDYFVNKLGGMVLEGYNIVGDGTPQALLPILTGHTEWELPEARRGKPGASTVDAHPWIWKRLKELGYVSQYGEDGASVGTFTYRMLGFQEQPVDHYMRPFYIKAERTYGVNHPYCLGSLPRHLVMLNWVRDFFLMYRNKPKFSFLFHSEYTHEHFNQLRVAENDLLNFLQYMNDRGFLNNTALLLMADHGARFHAMRQTVQGKYEERMPYFGFRFPPWFQEKYPKMVHNFKINTGRLTTPFDIHETLMDIANLKEDEEDNFKVDVDASQRAISLFNEIPPERTCAQAEIENHWCACLNWQSVDLNQPVVGVAAQKIVDAINRLTRSYRHLCEELSVANITTAALYAPHDNLLKFKKSQDSDGRVADLSDDMTNMEKFYQLSIVTSPSKAIYEATIKYDVHSNVFVVNDKEISRINKYGDQPSCIMAELPHLRPYCYCKSQSGQHS